MNNLHNFDINIYNNISNYYIQYNGNKNLIITNILLNIKDNLTRIKYINHIDLYISVIEMQKKSIEEIKNNISNYDLESNLTNVYIKILFE